jgi:hypothetical protein
MQVDKSIDFVDKVVHNSVDFEWISHTLALVGHY